MSKIDSTGLLIELFCKLPHGIGLSIDELSGYPYTITGYIGVSQNHLDTLLYHSGILYFKEGQRFFKHDCFDASVSSHFDQNENKPLFRVTFHQTKLTRTLIVSFGHPNGKSSIHPHRLGTELLEKLGNFCTLHPIPEHELSSASHWYPLLLRSSKFQVG
jgi:hypothetical protein